MRRVCCSRPSRCPLVWLSCIRGPIAFQLTCVSSCIGFSRRISGLKLEQSPLRVQQGGEVDQRAQLRCVLAQVPVAHCLQPEKVLDDLKWLLNFGSSRRLQALRGVQQRADARMPLLTPSHAGPHRRLPGSVSGVFLRCPW